MNRLTKFSFALALLPLLAVVAKAEDWLALNMPNSYVSQGVYIASNTSATNIIPGQEVQVSSRAAILHSVTINTPGTTVGAVTSQLELFDAFESTIGTRRIATIDTTAKVTLFYDIQTTSTGLLAVNNGSPAADVTISYRRK